MTGHGFRGRAGVMATCAMVMVVGACGDEAEAPTFEIAGEWTSPFGSESIGATSWKSFDTSGALSFEQRVIRFDNQANSAIVQNLPDAEFGPNTFGRIVWTEPTASGFSYCTVAFGHATETEAQSATEQDVDRGDLAAGCAGFSWSSLTKK